MNNETEHHNVLHHHILKTVLYYDIFNYPLKSSEVFQFLGTNSVTQQDVIHALHRLTENKQLFRFRDDYYTVHPTENNIDRRIRGNSLAQQYLPIARRQANLISKFPFVRAVLASGSLAKDYMEDNSDLDFFIVTAPGRLWIARTLLVLYKRVFLQNSHKYFCVNYFVDEDHLEIEDKNIFTATELATLIPLVGAQQYRQLMRRNVWIKDWFPNCVARPLGNVPSCQEGGLKEIMETIFNGFLGRKIEAFCHALTQARWKRLYEKDYPKTDFEIAFRSKSYASKNHPQHFQRKIMNLYAEKLRVFKLYDLDMNKT